MLGLEVLGAVLADDGDAGLDEQGQPVERDVLRGDDDGDSRTDLADDPLVALAQLLSRL